MTNDNSGASSSSPTSEPKEAGSRLRPSSSPLPSTSQTSPSPSPAAPAQHTGASAASAAPSESSQPSTTGATATTTTTTAAAAASSSALREDLLKSAVSFLSSPNVRSAETAKKVAFLRQKGLTQAEIEEAFKRVGESGVNAAAQTPVQTSTSAPTAGPVAPRPAVPPRPTTAYTQVVYYPLPPAPPMPFQRIVGLALLVGVSTVGLTAAVLNIIKRFIGPIFDSIAKYQLSRYSDRREGFKMLKETLTKEEKKDDLDEVLAEEENTLVKVTEKHQVLSEKLSRLVTIIDDRVKTLQSREPYGSLRDNLSGLKDVITQQSDSIYSSYSPYSVGRSNSPESPAIQSFKSEIRSFKGMLLNRRNFPMVNAGRPSTPIKQEPSQAPQ